MRALLVAVALLLLGTTTARASGFDAELEYGHTSGWAPPLASGGDPVSYPFTQETIDLRVGLTWSAANRTGLGLPVDLYVGLLGGWVLDEQYEMRDDELDVGTIPLRLMMQAGTSFPIVRTPRLQVEAHFMVDWWTMRPTWATDFMVAAFYGGGRARYHAGTTWVEARYDLRPFWLGTDRIEHALGDSIGLGAFGVRAELTLGQERRLEGGYEDVTFLLGVEVGR